MTHFAEYLASERGRLARLAEALGLTPGAISQWGGVVPPLRVLEVERATGIPRYDLRPDMYPRDHVEAAQ